MTWGDYENAHVRVHFTDRTVIIEPAAPGQVGDDFPAEFGGETVFIITAHDPCGEPATAEANAAAEQRLSATLDALGVTRYRAEGGDAEWVHVEASELVVGVDEATALKLGREFGQVAIFGWSPEAWEIIACDGTQRTTLGWQLLPG
ncbi:DUF3293 domain-containing protein [Kribbia dieselivorans]|uniref:DUF3293 domain-containing protein n=1 Tax=Kribbia dieselivorans TaxID=331526 RepID=UPI000839A614|nr:DUF3293 domain-containing protein [Kribbia dieselivorans]